MENMKKFVAYSLLAAAALAFAGCAREQAFEPGTPDDPDCMGVYFPTQEGTGDIEIDPAEKITSFTFTAKRAESKSETVDVPAATVPVKVIAEEGVFTVSPITFEAGQIETTFTVSFPNIEVGKTYPCEIRVEDPKYASLYTTLPTSLCFSVTAVKWNPVEKDGITVGTYKDYSMADMYGVGSGVRTDVPFEERADMPGMYRIKNLFNVGLMSQIFAGYDVTSWITDDTKYFIIDATDPNAVVIPAQKVYLLLSPNDGEISLRSAEGSEGVLKDNVITFPEGAIEMNFANGATWYPTASGGQTKFILPGGKDTDYSLKLRQTGYSNEGKLPVNFIIGADVKEVKYVLANKLRADEIPGVSEELAKNPDAVSISETGTVPVELETEKTGVYTLVAAAYDEKGNKTADASLEISYVANGDDKSVIIDGLVDNPSAIEQAKGISSDNNIAFFVQGEEITEATVKLYDYTRFVGDQNAVIEDLYKSSILDSEKLAELNGDGYSGYFGGLAPGTKYIMLVWATNGYDEVIIASDPITTTGDPLPIYAEYSIADFNEEFVITDEKDFYGTWNLYGVDYYGKLGIREYMGKVTIEDDTDHANQGPDDEGLIDQFVYATGMMGKYRTANMPSDKIQLDLYDGVLYISLKGPEDLAWTFNYYAKAANTAITGTGGLGGYYIAAIPVLDGYYAFVDVTRYAANYNFCGLFWRYNNGNIGAWYDYLLVDPEKDDNGVATNAAIQTALQQVRDVQVSPLPSPLAPTQTKTINKENDSLGKGVVRDDIRPERRIRFATLK